LSVGSYALQSAAPQILAIKLDQVKGTVHCGDLRLVSPDQIKAPPLSRLTVSAVSPLADAAEVSIPTIKRLEAHDGALGGRHETGTKIRAALERAGVEFIDENGGGAGVRLRKLQQNKR
jgi:hypothetical protein